MRRSEMELRIKELIKEYQGKYYRYNSSYIRIVKIPGYYKTVYGYTIPVFVEHVDPQFNIYWPTDTFNFTLRDFNDLRKISKSEFIKKKNSMKYGLKTDKEEISG